MYQFHEDHDDDDEEKLKAEDDRGWGWWMILPVVALGLLAYQVSEAAMTSIFDEDE